MLCVHCQSSVRSFKKINKIPHTAPNKKPSGHSLSRHDQHWLRVPASFDAIGASPPSSSGLLQVRVGTMITALRYPAFSRNFDDEQDYVDAAVSAARRASPPLGGLAPVLRWKKGLRPTGGGDNGLVS